MGNRGYAAVLILLVTASGMTAPAAAQTGFELPRLATAGRICRGSGTSAR